MGCHNVFIDEEGCVWTCGLNETGQLGLGDRRTRSHLTKINNLPIIRRTLVGNDFTMFLDIDGYVWISGKLDACSIDTNVPIRIEYVNCIVKMACGFNHCLLLDHDGNVFSWGSNEKGQLGTDDLVSRPVPTQIFFTSEGAMPKIKDISCGYRFSTILDVDGNCFSFGCGAFEKLCHKGSDYITLPTKINQGQIDKIYSGPENTMLIDFAGKLYTFGSLTIKNRRQVNESLPILIEIPQRVKLITCGHNQLLAVDIDNNIWGFGRSGFGGLGLGYTDSYKKFRKSPYNCGSVEYIQNNGGSTIIINSNGEYFTFGNNEYGKLGLGNAQKSNELEPSKLYIRGNPLSSISRSKRTKSSRK